MHSFPQIAFTRVSRNAKTGPIPVTTTAEETCPEACPLKTRLMLDASKDGGGCYAESGPLAIFWRKVTERKSGMAWEAAMSLIAALPKGTLWRHNQAGDLPGIGDKIDPEAMAQLIWANKGRRGFTYTHKPVEGESGRHNRELIKQAIKSGFAVNLSADNLSEADRLADLGIGPVVAVLPATQATATKTPGGKSVAICPATIADNVTCATCGLCARIDRKAIIGFPAHGTSKRKASAIAMGA